MDEDDFGDFGDFDDGNKATPAMQSDPLADVFGGVPVPE